jgi:hypothetical protein
MLQRAFSAGRRRGKQVPLSREAPARRLPRLLIVFVLPLFLPAVPVLAHGATAGSMPLVPAAVHLKHRKPAEIVALFAREELPASANERVPRAARFDSAGSLLPAGIEALTRTATDEVILVGAEERFPAMLECLRVVDAPG